MGVHKGGRGEEGGGGAAQCRNGAGGNNQALQINTAAGIEGPCPNGEGVARNPEIRHPKRQT